MKKYQKNHFWNIALFTRFNLHMAVSLSLKTVLCLLLSIILNSTHRMVSCIQEGSLLTGTSRLCMRATFLAISALSSTDLISTQLML